MLACLTIDYAPAAFLTRQPLSAKLKKNMSNKAKYLSKIIKKERKKTYSAMAACPRLCAAQTIRFSSFKAIPPTVGTMLLNIIMSKTFSKL